MRFLDSLRGKDGSDDNAIMAPHHAVYLSFFAHSRAKLLPASGFVESQCCWHSIHCVAVISLFRFYSFTLLFPDGAYVSTCRLSQDNFKCGEAR
jgi:hypothetical protein